jgi:hypothetical protein
LIAIEDSSIFSSIDAQNELFRTDIEATCSDYPICGILSAPNWVTSLVSLRESGTLSKVAKELCNLMKNSTLYLSKDIIYLMSGLDMINK